VSARPGRDCGGWHIASQGWHFAQQCQQIKQISGFFLAAEEIENDYRRWPEFESSARLARRHERPSPSQKLAARLNRRSRSGHIGTRQRFFSRW